VITDGNGISNCLHVAATKSSLIVAASGTAAVWPLAGFSHCS